LPLSGSIDFCSPRLIGGWVWDSDHATGRVDVEIIAHGAVVGRTTAEAWRSDLHTSGVGDGFHAYWFKPENPLDDSHVEVKVVNTSHYLTRNRNAIPLPDDELIYLVVGSRDAVHFLQTGASDLAMIRELVASAGMSWQRKRRRVLDWGCGCGRIARHWQPYSDQVHLFGVDIDEELISWCRNHLHFGSFSLSRLEPPLPFPDAHFDVVYATSVLTHLLFENQYAWMAELWRVLDGDGIAVLTAHGPSILINNVSYVRSATAPGRTGLTLIDEEIFFWIDNDEGSNSTSNVVTRGAFEHFFSPFRVLAHKPRCGLMGIQDTYVLAKKTRGPLRLIPTLGDHRMSGTETIGSFPIELCGQRSLTALASAPGLIFPATIELRVQLPDPSLPSARSKTLPLPEKTSWTQLDAAYTAIAVDGIPAWHGTGLMHYSVRASRPMDGAELRLRQCALF